MKGDRIRYYDGYKYQLACDYSIDTQIKPAADIDQPFIRLTQSGRLTVRGGYAWDGPSGPTIDSPSSMRASLVHDALYQLMRKKLIGLEHRPAADELLYRLCIEDGMWKWRAWLWRREVKRFASFAALPENDWTMHVAP